MIYAGRIVEYGTKQDIIFNPQHPYTQGLIECLPKLDEDKERLFQISGVMPSLLSLPEGCYFNNRCDYADSECDVYPEEKEIHGRRVFCHKVK